METMIASSSHFGGGMEHGSGMGSEDRSRAYAFQPSGDLDATVCTMWSNYEQVPMSSNSTILGLGGEPFHYDIGNNIGTTHAMENIFDWNLSSNLSQTDWWSDLEPLFSKNTMDMNSLYTAPQESSSNCLYDIKSGVISGREMIRPDQGSLENASPPDMRSLVPSKQVHLLSASRGCSPNGARSRKRRRTRSGSINEGLVSPKMHRSYAKATKGGRLKERARAILETEFQFDPRPSRQTMQIQARLIRSTFNDVSKWFDLRRARCLPMNLDQGRLGFTPTEPPSEDLISLGVLSRKDSEGVLGPKQIAHSNKNRKGGHAASDSQRKKWQCTNSSCTKSLKNRSEWIRHENTHGQPKEYICMSIGCSRIVSHGAVPCQSCASFSQGPNLPIASCQCKRSKRRRFKRKDKLQEHLRKQHSLMLPSSMISAWTEQTDRDFGSRCGFCGEELQNWEIRLSHIAEHFENGCDMSSWNEEFTEGTQQLGNESETEEENEEYVSNFDEMDKWDSDDDSYDENGDAFPDVAPDNDEPDGNQGGNSYDGGSGDSNDTGGNWYWQDCSSSKQNSSNPATANPELCYALVIIVCSGNFSHDIYSLERSQLSSATFHAVSNNRLRQVFVVTFRKNQIKIGSPQPKTLQQENILALVSEVNRVKDSSGLCFSFPYLTLSTLRQQGLMQIHKVQVATSGRILAHKTLYTSVGSRESHRAMHNLIADYRNLQGFRNLDQSTSPHNFDNLPSSMFLASIRNFRGLLCNTLEFYSQDPRTIHHRARLANLTEGIALVDKTRDNQILLSIEKRALYNSKGTSVDICILRQDTVHSGESRLGNVLHSAHNTAYSAAIFKPQILIDDGKSCDNPIPEVSLNLHSANVYNFTDSHITLSGIGHFPITGALPATSICDKNVSESSPCLEFPIPYGRNETFVGREATLQSIDQALQNNKSHTVVLYGLGGIGKTQIALEYAHRSRENFSCIFWVNAARASNLAEHIPKDCLSTNSSSWLLVIDNADDPSILDDLWPSQYSGSVIVTTRDRSLDLPFEDPSSISRFEVTPFKKQESAELLRKIAGQAAIDDEAMGVLYKSLEGIPMAIAQASTYIRYQNISISRYNDLFDEAEHKLLDGLLTDGLEADTTLRRQSVLRTWEMSFDLIKSENTTAAELLLLMAFSDNVAQIHGALKNRAAEPKLDMPPSSAPLSLLRKCFPEQLARFTEQQIKEGLDLLLELYMVVLSYSGTMVEVCRQSKEVMQLHISLSNNQMDDFLQTSMGVA